MISKTKWVVNNHCDLIEKKDLFIFLVLILMIKGVNYLVNFIFWYFESKSNEKKIEDSGGETFERSSQLHEDGCMDTDTHT